MVRVVDVEVRIEDRHADDRIDVKDHHEERYRLDDQVQAEEDQVNELLHVLQRLQDEVEYFSQASETLNYTSRLP